MSTPFNSPNLSGFATKESLDNLVDKTTVDLQTIAGQINFTLPPDCVDEPTGNSQLANKLYVDKLDHDSIGFNVELTNSSGASNTTWIFGSKVFDSHDMYNTSTGLFTIPTGQAGIWYFYLNALAYGPHSGQSGFMMIAIRESSPQTDYKLRMLNSFHHSGQGYLQTNGGVLVDCAEGQVFKFVNLAAINSFITNSTLYPTNAGGFRVN